MSSDVATCNDASDDTSFTSFDVPFLFSGLLFYFLVSGNDLYDFGHRPHDTDSRPERPLFLNVLSFFRPGHCDE